MSHESTVGMANDVDSLWVDAVLAFDQIEQGGQVSHIIDTTVVVVTASAGSVPELKSQRVRIAVRVSEYVTVLFCERRKVEIALHVTCRETVSMKKKEQRCRSGRVIV